MIPTEEWLQQAKRLPVGQSRRVQHRFEGRQNMVVRNNPEGWSCYCHACGTGGFVPKEYVKILPEEPSTVYQMLPPDLVALDKTDTYTQERVLRYLATKGIDNVHLQDAIVMFSPKSQRVLFGMDSQSGVSTAWIGRSIVGAQPKWVHYSSPTAGYPDFMYSKRSSVTHTAVVCEDLLSTLKVGWACPDTLPLCSLGTRLSNTLIQFLLRQNIPVVVFYDGDRAGEQGAAKAVRRLTGLGLVARAVTVLGHDPKDLTAEQIQAVVAAT